MEEITLPQSQQVEEAATAGAALPTAAPEASVAPPPPPSDVLRLRGLPFSATEADIVEFFKGFELKGAPLLCKRNGRASGECYVQMGGEDPVSAAAAALEALNRQNMGHRYIEIFPSTEADLQTAKTLGQDRLKGFVVRLRGLPYTASAIDVIKFFNGVEVVRGIEGVVFTYASDGRPTGEAFVEVQDEAGLAEAMKRHKETMGTRYIELFPSTKADLIQAIQHNRLILGSYRERRGMMLPPHHQGQYMQVAYHGMAPMGRYHPQQQMQMSGHPHQVQYVTQNAVGGIEEVTELFTGVNIGGQNVQMIAPQQQQYMGQQGGQRVQGGPQQRFNNRGGAGGYNNGNASANANGGIMGGGKYSGGYTQQQAVPQQHGGAPRQQQQQQRPFRAQQNGGGLKQQQQQVQGGYQMQGMANGAANGTQNIMLQQQPYIIQQGGMQYEVTPMPQEQYFGHQHMQQGYGHPMQSGLQGNGGQQYHMSNGQGGYTLVNEVTMVAPGELVLKQGEGPTTIMLQQQ